MDLITACRIGQDCGLETVADAVWQIDHMAMSIFAYDKMEEELTELYEEFAALPTRDILIEDYLKPG